MEVQSSLGPCLLIELTHNLLPIVVQENLKDWSGLNVQMFGLSVNSWEQLEKAGSLAFPLANTHHFYLSTSF